MVNKKKKNNFTYFYGRQPKKINQQTSELH